MKYRASYLSIQGKAVTPNSEVMSSGGRTGPLTSSSLCDWLSIPDSDELVLNFTIQSVQGVNPTLTINLLVLDPLEPSNQVSAGNTNPPLATLAITPTGGFSSVGTLRLIIANGQAAIWSSLSPSIPLGTFNVPFKWQIQFIIGGTSPIFSIIGTYEARL